MKEFYIVELFFVDSYFGKEVADILASFTSKEEAEKFIEAHKNEPKYNIYGLEISKIKVPNGTKLV